MLTQPEFTLWEAGTFTELGLTLAQRKTDYKSNEIPAVQELLKELNIKGHMIVADSLNCQKETAKLS